MMDEKWLMQTQSLCCYFNRLMTEYIKAFFPDSGCPRIMSGRVVGSMIHLLKKSSWGCDSTCVMVEYSEMRSWDSLNGWMGTLGSLAG